MSLALVLTLGLIILPIIWFITDPRPISERFKQYLFPKAILLLLIQYSLIYLNFINQDTLLLEGQIEILKPAGVILFIAGIFISIWAKLTMGRVWGRPAQHDIKRQNKLIIEGPFKFSRNPIYLGLILTYLGYSLALRSIFVFVNLFLIAFFYNSILKEEKLLEKHFGKTYLEYKKQVKRFI